MAAVTLTPHDLAPFAEIPTAKALAMIEDALATAAIVAPCITTAEFTKTAAAKAIIRAAVLRWHEAGSGALSQRSENKGPFGSSETIDNRQQRRGMFWPAEITQLQELCKTGGPSGAFTIDTVGAEPPVHADICSLNFGALYCSCGAILTGSFPLYEV